MRIVAAFLCCLAVGCSSRATTAPLSDSAFIAVMADLRRLQDSIGRKPDSTTRAAVLRRHRASVADIEATAAFLADHPDRAANVWHAIDKRAVDVHNPK